MIAMDR